MSATLRLTFESAQNVESKPLIPKIMASRARCRKMLNVLGPLLRFCGIYSLAVATCFPAWKAFENSMSFTGVALLSVAFLLLLSSFETSTSPVTTSDLI